MPGIGADADNLIYNNKGDNAKGNKCQGQKLTEHTLVHRRGHLSEVATTMTMHTLNTRSTRGFFQLMDMQ